MARIVYTVALILLVGVWITPFIGAAAQPGRESSSPESSDFDPVTQSIQSRPSSPRPSSSEPQVDPVLARFLDLPSTQPAATVPSPTLARLATIKGTPGFWRLGKTREGAWWFVTPDDQLEFLNTVTTVQPWQFGRHEDGPHFLSRDFNGPIGGEGDMKLWATKTLARVRDMGFKGLGAWCNPVFHDLDVPMTRDLNVWSWATKACQRLYHPDWNAIAERAISTQVEKLKDNKHLVGYYIDNELDWFGGASPNFYFDHLPPEDPNRQQVVGVIRQVWPELATFNTAWGLQLASWDDLPKLNALPTDKPEVLGKLTSVWVEKLARDYFTITTTLIRKYDPNHLILGVRYKGYAPEEVVRASKGLTDAQSLNYYVSDGRLDEELFRMMNEASGGQPLIITEYSFHALDGRSGNRNTFGFAAQVLDQQARADGYRLMTRRLAQIPWVVGADWFQWSDEPPSGRTVDGEDVNFGIVDIDDRAYELLVAAVKETTPKLNGWHEASVGQYDTARTDLYRESFAQKPVMQVPFLARPVVLNGELSDWEAKFKVPNIRHGQTLGLDRSELPVPNFYLGWTDAGLYVGFEVFDNDIQGAPATGWWWTRDNVEFWVSTRPVASDQNFYNAYSHQFFFVPVEFPGKDGQSGTVGRWHRPGDNLQDSLIPHPDVKQAVRVLPNKYVAEMFIPAKALNGFDPRNQPAMAFNLHVRNFHHATDYFWSAPKEVQTQLRPNTWGNVYMAPPETSATITTAQ
jgi:hypothetical protein